MKNKQIALVVLFIMTLSLAKSSPSMRYYEQINLAEEYLMKDSINKSLDIFFGVFEEYESPYIYDFVVPLQVAIKTNKKDVYSLFIDLLNPKEKIYIDDFFLRNKVYYPSSVWQEMMSLKNSIKKDDNRLENTIDSLFKCDQKDRKMVYNKMFLFRKKAIKTWDDNTKQRIDFFFDLFKDENYPTEKQMGVDKSFLYNRNMIILFFHYPKTYSEYKTHFDTWLEQGGLHPRHYAWIVDFEYRHDKMLKRDKKCYFKYAVFAQDKLKIKDLNRKKLLSIEQNRAEIGLPSLEHELMYDRFLKKNHFSRLTFF